MSDVFGHTWAGRRVSVVGLARSGQAAVRLLCRLGCRVYATDRRDTPELREAAQQLKAHGVESVELGRHERSAVEASRLVVVSPGVPETSEPVRWALERGVPIISEIELAFLFCPAPIIAVTGTNGKSSVVTMLAQVLTAAGRRALACGNVGIPFCSVVEQLTPDALAVVEVSSFQLLWCHELRPMIGVLLNLGANHLDRHAGPAAYLQAKARLFQRQTPEDWAVLNGQDERVASLASRLRARVVWIGATRANPPPLTLAAPTLRALPDNAQAVLQVARILGIPDPLTWQVLREFRGLEHRLERVATLRGVHYVNDSKSTTPDSTLFALSQVPGEVVLVLGGRDKGLDFGPLVDRVHTRGGVRGVVLIGESRATLRTLVNGGTRVCEGETLQDGVSLASRLAGPGSTVLFSPACASFDMFRDFEARGHAFKAAVTALAREPQRGD